MVTGTLRRFGAKLRTSALRLRREEDGAVAIMTAASLFGIVLLVGGAVDIYRHEMLRQKAQNAMDRAVLAAASLSSVEYGDGPNADAQANEARRSIVAQYMEAAGLPAPPDADITLPDTNTRKSVSVEVATSYALPMTFLRLAGIRELSVPVQSTANETEQYVEVSLMLDVSGSMRWGVDPEKRDSNPRRIDALKPAAQNFINRLLSDDRMRRNTSISIVPYAGQVNIGQRMFDTLGITREHSNSSCAHFRPNEFAKAGMPKLDRMEQQGHFTIYNYHTSFLKHSASGEEWNGKDRQAFEAESYARPMIQEPWWCPDDPHAYMLKPYDLPSETVGTLEYNSVGTLQNTGTTPIGLPEYNERKLTLAPGEQILVQKTDLLDHVVECERVKDAGRKNCNFNKGESAPLEEDRTLQKASAAGHIGVDGDRTAITYLSNDRDELTEAIDNYRLYDGTGTANAMKWGLTLLDPAFKSHFLTGLDNGAIPNVGDGRPADFRNRPRAYDDPDTQKYMVLMTDGKIGDQKEVRNDKTEYHPDRNTKTLKFGGTTYNQDKAIDQFRDVCNTAKSREKAVVVFTIGFALKDGDGMKDELRNCATDEGYYYDVSDDIDSAFTAIAATIQQLRLTQ